ncbi:MAG: tripartite tricarboxylate transporter permease [Alcaligenes sp.]
MTDILHNFIGGLGTIFAPGPIAAIVVGVCIGIFFGAIPGISGIMAIAIVLPLTFYVDPVIGITMLLAIYKAGIYGGSISAILINTPGAAASFLTAQDGHALARAGKAGKALAMALYASVTGEALATLVLIFVAAPISVISLQAGPIEKVFLLIFAFTVVGSMTGESIARGMLSCCLGMLFAMVGMSPITGAARFTFDIPALMSGFTFLPLLMGVLVMPEVIEAVKRRRAPPLDLIPTASASPDDSRVTGREFRSVLGTILKSTGIGTFIGALPGLGSSAAAFMAYGEAKRSSKNPDEFGKGSLHGVAAAESANNAVCGSSMIPMLTLSIPGDDVTALLMGAFLIHGITPGPTIFYEHTDVIYGIFAGFLITDLFLLIIARAGFKFWTRLASVPRYYIFPCVTVFAFFGAYTVNQEMYDILLLIVFTILGCGMRRLGLSTAAFIIGFILTPLLEQNLDQAVTIVGTEYGMLARSPMVWIFTALSLFWVYSALRLQRRTRLKAAILNQAETQARA